MTFLLPLGIKGLNKPGLNKPKIKKDLVSTHSQKLGLSKTQDLNKIIKNPKHPLAEIGT